MATLWKGYLRVLGKYPLATMCSTTGTLSALGDCISQVVMEKKALKTYDTVRSGRFFVLGFCVMGPMIRFWYLGLDKLYHGTKYAPAKMVITDQLVGAPVILCTFVTALGFLRGDNWGKIKSSLERDYVTILINNYKVWPAAQAVNFYFMPLQHRVLFVNFVALFWNTYLAWVTEGQQTTKE